MADTWAVVLDDLDARLTAAESGMLDALDGWAVPPAPPTAMSEDERARAQAINDRQRALEAQLRIAMAQVAGSAASLRHRSAARWASDSGPVYVDRSA